ncbi:hypothetical protein SynPROSU1_01880 [Synechococcus sp. PROS-U-1]|nr:hypothetical protein SynPROSU1_01880 [Synechococcus sp. PROS-U-1]
MKHPAKEARRRRNSRHNTAHVGIKKHWHECSLEVCPINNDTRKER